MRHGLMLLLSILLSSCNELSIFVADSLFKNDGDITSVVVNDQGRLTLNWHSKNHDASAEYDIYMVSGQESATQALNLKADAKAQSVIFTEFEKIPKAWKLHPKLSGKLIGRVKGVLSFTYEGEVKSGEYYFFQVAPKGSAKAILPQGGLVRVNLGAPEVKELEEKPDSVQLSWQAIDGATEYGFYDPSDLVNPVFTSPTATLSVSYEQLNSLKKLCIRSKRGELLSDECKPVDFEVPATPVSQVILDSEYSRTPSFNVQWTHWPDSKIVNHSVKLCRDSDCQLECSEPQEVKSLNTTLSGSEGKALYVCVQTYDSRGMASRWQSSLKALTVDTVPPSIFAGSDLITRTAVDIDASTKDAVRWEWSLVSAPVGVSAVSFSDQAGEDTRVILPQDGVYRLRLTAYDRAGNTSSDDVVVTMDTTAPTFAGISQVLRKASGEYLVFWYPAIDLLSTPESLRYEICVAEANSNGCLVQFSSHYQFQGQSYQASIAGLDASKDYEFLIRVRDAAGNSTLGPSLAKLRVLNEVVEVAAGSNHSCAVVGADKNVMCWGRNDSGQIGDGSSRSRKTPTMVPSLSGISKLALGDNHSCALKASDGTVYCWGSNTNGQLGDGTTTDRTLPTQVPGLSGMGFIAAGASHSCAAISSGASVSCWGLNSSYQLGDGTTTQRLTPVTVTGVTSVVALAAGGRNSCAVVTPNNRVRCWGRNSEGQLGDGSITTRTSPIQIASLTGVTHLSVGNNHSCAIQGSENRARCWGQNNYGQIGNGNTSNQTSPVLVNSSLPLVSKVLAGQDRSCGISQSDGSVKCWGRNTSGQLGNGNAVNSSLPVDVIGMSNPQSLALGGLHTCSVNSSDESVRCLGDNAYGQLGRGSEFTIPTPAKPVLADRVANVVSSDHFTCAILENDRSVQCWGINSYGALGDGTTIKRSTPAPVLGLTGVKSLALGFYHGCALLQDGSVKCWGRNNYGQLGDNSTTDRLSPISVSIPQVKMLAASDWGTCALLSGDDSVRCWGENSRWQVGDGTNVNRLLPTPVSGLTGVEKLYGGTFQYCAIMKADGSVKCWGENGNGTLGDGTTATRSTPVSVQGIADIKDLSMGIFHVCASTNSDGSLYCWGLNNMGQIGDGSTINRLVPVQVPGISQVSAIGGGEHHTCAVVGAEKKVKCWGQNSSGELGTGSYSSLSAVPVDVIGVQGVDWLGAGRAFNCVRLEASADIRCWGRNREGELGVDGKIYSDLALGEAIRVP